MWMAESTTQGTGQTVPQRRALYPPVTMHLYGEELVGSGAEGSPTASVLPCSQAPLRTGP